MPFHCSVPNCKGNYLGGPKVTVFQFPTDEKLKKKWLSIIGRENFVPSSSSRVCHLHFENEDVVWGTRTCIQKTGEVISVALKKPHLKRGAVPVLFPKCPASPPKQEITYECPEQENLSPGNEHRAPSLQYTSTQTGCRNTVSLIFLGEILIPTTEVILPCTVRETVYRTICLSDHNYARPYASVSNQNSEDVADCNSKTSDRPSRIAAVPNRVTAVQQGPSSGGASEPRASSGDESSGSSASRVGEQAASSLCLRLSYSQYNCAVYRCATNARKMPGIVCHSFPKDENLRREWIARCRRSDEVNVRNARICSAHFRPEDYERDLRNELLGLPLRKKLLPTAVPSLNLPSWDEGELLASGDVSVKTGISKRETVSLWTEDDMQKAIKACREGASRRQASETFGVPHTSLQRRLQRGADSQVQKRGRPRKKLRKDDNDSESDKMDAVVQQILQNPPDVVIKEETIVKEEVDLDPDTARQHEFEFVSVKNEPEEDIDESTSAATEESSEQMGHDQELPLIIKEEILKLTPSGKMIEFDELQTPGWDCDDYVDPFRVSEEGYWQ